MKNLIGTKVYQYSYYLNDTPKDELVISSNSYKEDSFDVLLQNQGTIVINDERFTSIGVSEEYCCHKLDDLYLSIAIDGERYELSVIFSLYSSKELSHESIKEIILGNIKKQLKPIGEVNIGNIINKMNEVIK